MFLLNVVVMSIYEHLAQTSFLEDASDGAKLMVVVYLMVMLIGDVRRMTG